MPDLFLFPRQNAMLTEVQGDFMASTTHIEVDSETAQALADHAAAIGLTIGDYLRTYFAAGNGSPPIDDPDKWLDDLAEGLPDLPSLPTDFSTQDIYSDHD